MRENKFIIVVPVYNSEDYIRKSLESILLQTYNNYKLVVIDDCSTDKTFDIISDIRDNTNIPFTSVRNPERVGSPLANFIMGIELCSKDDEDIIITVDGDDWLSGDGVLSFLNEVYQDDEIYMTYGQYEPLSKTYSNYCQPIPNTRTYRKSGAWLASHLRTVKRKLFDKIDRDDLKETDGEYYKCAGDAAYMYPIIEMSGSKRIKFIEKVLYIYNDLNTGNEMKIYMKRQLSTAKEIRDKKEYDEIK